MRILLCLLLTMTLTGCLGNLSLDGLGATTTSTTAAVIGTAVAGPTAGVIAGVAAGVATDAAIAPTETTTDVLNALPEEERLEALKNQQIWEAIESLGYYSILAVLAFFFVPMIIGYFIPNGRQRKLERDTYNHPDFKM